MQTSSRTSSSSSSSLISPSRSSNSRSSSNSSSQVAIIAASTRTTPVVSLPTEHSAFDPVTIIVAVLLLLTSLSSVVVVFYLRLKSRSARRLHRFTFHSSARILFASLVSLWALTEVLRMPTSQIRAIITSFPSLNSRQQDQLCRIQSVLSLGIFEPGFLVALLFLVKIPISRRGSRRRRRRKCTTCSISSSGSCRNLEYQNDEENDHMIIWSMLQCILSVCIPISAILYLVLYQFPNWFHLPEVFVRTAVAFVDRDGKEVVLCACPLAGATVFGVFGVLYSLVLQMKCWKVMSLAINKRLRSRINALAMTVLICIGLQVVLSSLSVFWSPEEVIYYVLVLVVFASVAICAAVGEGVLVIFPIYDALKVGIIGPPPPPPPPPPLPTGTTTSDTSNGLHHHHHHQQEEEVDVDLDEEEDTPIRKDFCGSEYV